MTTPFFISVVRGLRLALHLYYGMILACFYPHLTQMRQHQMLKRWSIQMLEILNIELHLEGPQSARGETGCLLIANHISWLDIFVLNAIQPTQFIAKAEVRHWPLVGWLCQRGGTIFIERAVRRNAAAVNRHISTQLTRGACVGLFPEGTTTDGKQVGHFHSALIQPAIDAGVKLCPIALRYHNPAGEISAAAAFTGDTTLVQSIWAILRCTRLNVLAIYTPDLNTSNANRRVLASVAQHSIARALGTIAPAKNEPDGLATIPLTLLSAQSAYVLLLDPILSPRPD
jgi:1-acyl-sn-glycerol-3-phosphate acyltransferase